MTYCAELIGEEGWYWYWKGQMELIVGVQPLLAPTSKVFKLRLVYENS